MTTQHQCIQSCQHHQAKTLTCGTPHKGARSWLDTVLLPLFSCPKSRPALQIATCPRNRRMMGMSGPKKSLGRNGAEFNRQHCQLRSARCGICYCRRKTQRSYQSVTTVTNRHLRYRSVCTSLSAMATSTYTNKQRWYNIRATDYRILLSEHFH